MSHVLKDLEGHLTHSKSSCTVFLSRLFFIVSVLLIPSVYFLLLQPKHQIPYLGEASKSLSSFLPSIILFTEILQAFQTKAVVAVSLASIGLGQIKQINMTSVSHLFLLSTSTSLLSGQFHQPLTGLPQFLGHTGVSGKRPQGSRPAVHEVAPAVFDGFI